MKPKDILDQLQKINPEKLIIGGIKTLTNINPRVYSKQKTEAKGKAELTFIGEKKLEEVQTQYYVFDTKELHQETDLKAFDVLTRIDHRKVAWLNFHGLHDVEMFKRLGETINLDRLTIRQIVDTTQRPKAEEYDEYLFFSIKSILESAENKEIKVEQISFLLSRQFVISFQEEVGDHFEYIRTKIIDNLGLIRKRESDYLLVQLLDAILDNYFETIEAVNLRLTAIEQEILNEPKSRNLLQLEKERKETQIIKKSLTPFMESINAILNDKTKFVAEQNIKYFRDLRNSAASALEEVEASTKSLESLTNIYFSSLSQKMNETMKVLTTVATIFIPLTFIAGIYGMNFEYMPELSYKYGYFVIWGIMLSLLGFMIFYFKKKKWL